MDESAADIAELWGDYKKGGTLDARERLILHYSPLVKFVAGRVAAGLPQNIEQSDLVSYGIFGLIDAIDKFDPGRGYKFETYAISRIKGAIIDELRSIDWVPRSVRAKARAIERAISKLENELRRSPEDAEVAAELEWTDGELAHTLSQISFTGLVALDDLLAAADRSYRSQRDAAPDGAALPGLRYARNAVVHGELVVATTYAKPGAVLGAAALGTFALGEGPSTRWISRTSIPHAPKPSKHLLTHERSYDRHVAGRDVCAPLRTALDFLRDAIG